MDDSFNLPPEAIPPSVLGKIPLFAEIQKVLSWQGGPVNWDLAKQVAISLAAGENPAARLDGNAQEEAADQVRLAELWLAEITGIEPPAHVAVVRAATPIEWAEYACDAFPELIDPVAAKVAGALSGQTAEMAGGPEAAVLGQVLGQISPMFMGVQTGTILGNLAQEVTGSHEIGLPTPDDALLLVTPAIDAVATEYALDRRTVRQWVAVRAVAHRLEFEGIPGVRGQFFSLYHNYVASLDVDLSEGMQRLKDFDVSDPSRLQEALADEGLFSHRHSPATEAAAAKLGLFLSMTNAHAAVAVDAAAERIGDQGRVAETFTRRAAVGGRGLNMFLSFIGLEPANPAPARAFARSVLARLGWTGLNKVWDEPTTLPSAEEIAEPDQWMKRVAS